MLTCWLSSRVIARLPRYAASNTPVAIPAATAAQDSHGVGQLRTATIGSAGHVM
jgi:hypothetical protein